MNIVPNFRDTVSPSCLDIELAIAASEIISKFMASNPASPLSLRVVTSEGDQAETLVPLPAFKFLADAIVEIAKGNPVAILPMQTEITIQQAAELLGVSRSFIMEQLDEGNLPYRTSGTKRIIMLPDLAEYKRSMDRRRVESLDELAAEARKINLGY
jgi:excisionase family DNA binding protein